MGSRLVTPAGRHTYNRLIASNLDLSTTSRRVLFWIEGLLSQLGQDGTDRLMGLLVPLAHAQRNPSAWFNWVTGRPWTAIVADEQIRFVHNGPPPPARREKDCGVVLVGDCVTAALG